MEISTLDFICFTGQSQQAESGRIEIDDCPVFFRYQDHVFGHLKNPAVFVLGIRQGVRALLNKSFQVLIEKQHLLVGRLKGLPVLTDKFVYPPGPFEKQSDGTNDNEHEGVNGPAEGTDGAPQRLVVEYQEKILEDVADRSGHRKTGERHTDPPEIGPDKIVFILLAQFKHNPQREKGQNDHQD